MRKSRVELKLGGKVRPLLFDFEFLDFLTETLPLSELGPLAATRPWKLIPHLILAGVKAGMSFENLKPGKEVIDLKTVSGWILSSQEPEAVNDAFQHAQDALGFFGALVSGKAAVSQPTDQTGTDS